LSALVTELGAREFAEKPLDRWIVRRKERLPVSDELEKIRSNLLRSQAKRTIARRNEISILRHVREDLRGRKGHVFRARGVVVQDPSGIEVLLASL
jgi:hypothetical protein